MDLGIKGKVALVTGASSGLGLAAAIDYVDSVGLDRIAAYERELLAYASDVVSEIPRVRLIGTAARKVGVLSFIVDGVHPHDVAEILNREGVAVRAGHHCAMPLHEKFGIPSTTRASFYVYNTTEEVDHFIEALYKVKEIFG